MRKEDIKKALKCCSDDGCYECPYSDLRICYIGDLSRDALALVTEQEAEIERLKAENKVLTDDLVNGNLAHMTELGEAYEEIRQAKIEMLERLKKEVHLDLNGSYYIGVVLIGKINELIEEVKAE